MRRTTLRRKAGLKASKQGMKRSRVRPVNRKRKAKATLHAYGPAERRAWMVTLPCCHCGRAATDDYPSQQAHVCGSEGMSLKGRHDTTAPMCHDCHTRFDRWLPPFDWPTLRQEIAAMAPRYEKQWQDRCQEAAA